MSFRYLDEEEDTLTLERPRFRYLDKPVTPQTTLQEEASKPKFRYLDEDSQYEPELTSAFMPREEISPMRQVIGATPYEIEPRVRPSRGVTGEWLEPPTTTGRAFIEQMRKKPLGGLQDYWKYGQPAFKYAATWGLPEEKRTELSEKPWSDVYRELGGVKPESRAGRSIMAQFGIELGGEIIDLASRPSTWITWGVMEKAIPALGKTIFEKFPGVARWATRSRPNTDWAIKFTKKLHNLRESFSPFARAKIARMSNEELRQYVLKDKEIAQMWKRIPKARRTELKRYLIEVSRGEILPGEAITPLVKPITRPTATGLPAERPPVPYEAPITPFKPAPIPTKQPITALPKVKAGLSPQIAPEAPVKAFKPVAKPYVDKFGKTIVKEKEGIQYAINNIENPTYITVWDNDKKIGTLSVAGKAVAGMEEYITAGNVEISPKYRKRGIATEVFKTLLEYLPKGKKGIYAYGPEIISKKAISKIFTKLGGRFDKKTGNYIIEKPEVAKPPPKELEPLKYKTAEKFVKAKIADNPKKIMQSTLDSAAMRLFPGGGDELQGAMVFNSGIRKHFEKYIQSFYGKTMFDFEGGQEEIGKLLNKKLTFFTRRFDTPAEKVGAEKMFNYIKEEFRKLPSKAQLTDIYTQATKGVEKPVEAFRPVERAVKKPTQKLLEYVEKGKKRVAKVTQLPRGETFTLEGLPKKVGISAKARLLEERREIERLKVVGGEPATSQQIKQAHIIAKEKMLISEKGKPTPNYKFLAKQMTGKNSVRYMTREETGIFIDVLNRLEVKYGKPPKLPRTTKIITKEFADRISGLEEIGLKERFRPAWRVFNKIGLRKEVWEPAFETEIKMYNELMSFRKDALAQRKIAGETSESSRRIFRAIDNTLTTEDTKNITTEEQKVIAWGKRFFDKWAEKLKLSSEQRRKNYITHLFEKDLAEQLKTNYPLDPDLVRAMDFITPKTVFNPFLQQRLGKKIGLKEDFWSAIEAYEARELKVFHYEPLIKRIRVYEKFLPPNSARYLREYIARITNRPLNIDKELQQDLKELAGKISKLPYGDKLAKHLTQGNVGGRAAYNFTGLLYESFLGGRPASAIKNLGQNSLTISETGIVNFAKGKAWKVTADGKKALSRSLVLKSRKLGYLPGIDESFIKGLESKRRVVTMAMFRYADKQNVENAFSAGYMEAKRLGLPDEWCVKRGDEVAAKTQYIYTKLGGAMWTQTAPGRVLGVLTTWPENWAELMVEWGAGKPSQVYLDYQKATTKKVVSEKWFDKRKQMLRYLVFVALAMYIEKKTKLRALAYVGWTSIRSIANMLKGNFAGLDVIGSVAELLAGVTQVDKTMIKRAWGKIRPDRFVLIIRQLTDIAQGKKDWLTLFFLLKKQKKKKDESSAFKVHKFKKGAFKVHKWK